MPNQRKQRANRVPKGTAREDRWPQISRLLTKKMPKHRPSQRQGGEGE